MATLVARTRFIVTRARVYIYIYIYIFRVFLPYSSDVITPEKFTHKCYYYLLIFIDLYFSNFRPLTCFSVMIPEAV